MKATVSLRWAAERYLRQISEYSRATHGTRARSIYLADVRDRLDRLSDYPQVGAVRNDLNGAPSRCLACRQHLIFYHFAYGHVSILRILHKAIDIARWLQ